MEISVFLTLVITSCGRQMTAATPAGWRAVACWQWQLTFCQCWQAGRVISGLARQPMLCSPAPSSSSRYRFDINLLLKIKLLPLVYSTQDINTSKVKKEILLKQITIAHRRVA